MKMALVNFVTILLLASLCYSAKIKTDEQEEVKPKTMMSTGIMYQEDMDDLAGVMSKCNETFRIEMSYWDSFNDSGTFPDETDKTPKCYVRCVLEMTGVASMDSQFSPSRAAVVFGGQRGGKVMDDVEEMAMGCATQRDETCKCERAYGFLKCLLEKQIDKYDTIDPNAN